MAGYWLKLYVEILDDPKYYKLSDAARVGMYELMLLCKKIGSDGVIPSLEDVCFYTRRDVDWWFSVKNELAAINFLVECEEGIMIRKFSERQAPVPSTERSRQHRIVKQKSIYTERNGNDDATKRDGDTEEDTEEDIEKINNNTATSSKSPTDAEFFAHFGNFNNQREQKRWIALVESVGFEQAQRIAEWAEKKEINMTNRMGLMDSMETAAKNWKQGQSKPGKKDSNEDFFTKLNKLRVPEVIDGNA